MWSPRPSWNLLVVIAAIIFWLLTELVDGRLKGWWAGDFSVSLGSIASALGKWSALNGEDECLPAVCHHVGSLTIRAARGEADAQSIQEGLPRCYTVRK